MKKILSRIYKKNENNLMKKYFFFYDGIKGYNNCYIENEEII